MYAQKQSYTGQSGETSQFSQQEVRKVKVCRVSTINVCGHCLLSIDFGAIESVNFLVKIGGSSSLTWPGSVLRLGIFYSRKRMAMLAKLNRRVR